MAEKKKAPRKPIDILHAALVEAGYTVERDGWQENEHSKIRPFDNCEWLDVVEQTDGDIVRQIHFYFEDNSRKLTELEVYEVTYERTEVSNEQLTTMKK